MKTIQQTLSFILISLLGLSLAYAEPTIRHKTAHSPTPVESIQTREHIISSLKNIFDEISDDTQIQINKTPFDNLYEIIIDNGHILYTNPQAEFLIMGDVFDMKNKINITDQRATDLRAIEFDSLPFEKAIKIVKGTGERVIATFEDPNCYYCQKLNKELDQIENTTHYVFLLPILSDKSIKVANQIWCSNDPAQQWVNWMSKKEDFSDTPLPSDCQFPLDDNLEIANQIGISGTPTLIFEDGSIVGGLIPKAAIQARMDETKK